MEGHTPKREFKSTNWAEKVAYRQENKKALDRAFEIALRVLDLLENKRWTQAELARQMNVSPQYISRIVKGQELNLGFDVLDRLEIVLGGPIIKVVERATAENCNLNVLQEYTMEATTVTIAQTHTFFSSSSFNCYSNSAPPPIHTLPIENNEKVKCETGRIQNSPFLMSI